MVNSIVVVGALTCCGLLHVICDLKAAQMNVQRCLIREFMLYKFKLGRHRHCRRRRRRPKLLDERWRCSWSQYNQTIQNILLGLREPWRWGRIRLKPLITTRLCSKLWRQIQWVAFGEYPASSAFPNPVWLVIFTTTAKAFVFAVLSSKLPKYCKISDSPLYISSSHILIMICFFVWWHINLRGLFNAEAILVAER